MKSFYVTEERTFRSYKRDVKYDFIGFHKLKKKDGARAKWMMQVLIKLGVLKKAPEETIKIVRKELSMDDIITVMPEAIKNQIFMRAKNSSDCVIVVGYDFLEKLYMTDIEQQTHIGFEFRCERVQIMGIKVILEPHVEGFFILENCRKYY